MTQAPETAATLPAPPQVRDDPLSICGALREAQRHCTCACFAYHAAWRITRLLGLKANPTWHEGFYRQALARTAIREERPLRVLICASADETMLAVLTRVLGTDHGRTTARSSLDTVVHIVDACTTPLTLNSAYARRYGLRVTTSQDTAPTLRTVQGNFDLIVTDGLLSLLSDAKTRSKTLARLAELLTDNGVFLYTTRITHSEKALEYDRIGRAIQAITCLAWPRNHRLRLAYRAWTRPARPSPFTNHDDLRDMITAHFTSSQYFSRPNAPTLALRLHHHAWRRNRQPSTYVGILARNPHRACS